MLTRTVSESHLAMAKQLVTIVRSGSGKPNALRVTQLTPDDYLYRDIPKLTPGTLYEACVGLTERRFITFIFGGLPYEEERVYEEAALGFMDNPILRDDV